MLRNKGVSASEKWNISAPGRICLFGEHQDYLELPVITSAIDLRIGIEARKREDGSFAIHCPDIGTAETIPPERPVAYIRERDYFRSGINLLSRQGLTFPSGYDCTVRGRIPINSGTSSSSALMVAWMALLLRIASDRRAEDPLAVARLAHQAEVVEFNEPGGAMDHFASSCGGILYIDFGAGGNPVPLPPVPGKFVLGDSGEPKDTMGILARVKGGTLAALRKLNEKDPALTIRNLTPEKLEEMRFLLNPGQKALLLANIANRDLTQKALALFRGVPDPGRLGELLTLHQNELRDRLKISTPKIDRMIDAALKAGALGAKINGSGGGGCMFAYAPRDPESVAEAIAREGGKPYIVTVGDGVKMEPL